AAFVSGLHALLVPVAPPRASRCLAGQERLAQGGWVASGLRSAGRGLGAGAASHAHAPIPAGVPRETLLGRRGGVGSADAARAEARRTRTSPRMGGRNPRSSDAEGTPPGSGEKCEPHLRPPGGTRLAAVRFPSGGGTEWLGTGGSGRAFERSAGNCRGARPTRGAVLY